MLSFLLQPGSLKWLFAGGRPAGATTFSLCGMCTSKIRDVNAFPQQTCVRVSEDKQYVLICSPLCGLKMNNYAHNISNDKGDCGVYWYTNDNICLV